MSNVSLNSKYKGLNSDSRYFVITGGRGSGKSFSITVFLVLLTFEESNKVLFTRYTMSSAGMSIIPEFIEKLELMGLLEHFTDTSLNNCSCFANQN